MCEHVYIWSWTSQVSLVKNPPVNAGDVRDTNSVPGLGRSPVRGNSNPLQYSCLENPMDRGAWQSAVHRVAELETTEATLRAHTHTGPVECSRDVKFCVQSSCL